MPHRFNYLNMEHSVSDVFSCIFTALAVVDIVSVYCASNPAFSEKFMNTILAVFGSNVDLPNLKKRLQDIYINIVKHRLTFGLLCEHSLIENCEYRECNKPGCITMNDSIWMDSLKEFTSHITIEKNKLFETFDFAYENLSEFTESVNSYLNKFCSLHQCSFDSEYCNAKLAHIKAWIQQTMNKKLETYLEEHVIFCADDGYAYDAPLFGECRMCMNRLQKSWVKRMKDYIENENNFFVSALIEPKNLDFELDEWDEPSQIVQIEYSDPKEDLRSDFVKRTKGILRDKRRHLHNKGIK